MEKKIQMKLKMKLKKKGKLGLKGKKETYGGMFVKRIEDVRLGKR
jgi:hypothetical protein